MAINFPDSPTTGDVFNVGDKTWTWDGSTWNIVSSAGSDHGNLAGLGDDDHTQYLLADGTRTATELTVSGDLTVDTDTFHVDSTNNRVGIGTAAPGYIFEVASVLASRFGVATDYVNIDPDGNDRISLVSDTATGRPYLTFYNQDATGNLDRKGYIGFPDAASDASNIALSSDQGGIRLLSSAGEAVRIDASGNVGIGTTSPTQILDIQDADNAEINLNDSGGTVGTNTNAKLQFQAGSTNAGHVGFNNTSSGVMAITQENGSLWVNNKSANNILLRTSDNTRMTIDSSGNVGIGTTIPSYKLEVAGDISIRDSTPHLVFTDTDTNAESRISADSGYGSLVIAADFNNEQAGTNIVFSIDNTEKMRIDSSGNVGIGTTSPASDLHVADTAVTLVLQDTDGTVGGSMSSMIQFTDSTGAVQSQVGLGTATGYFLVDNNDGPMRVGTASADALYLRTNNANQLTIDATGNVGINDTTPSYTLDVNGTGRFVGNLSTDGQFFNTGGFIQVNNASRVVIDTTDATYPKIGNYYSSSDNLEVGSVGGMHFVVDANGNTDETFQWRSGGSSGAGNLLMQLDESANLTVNGTTTVNGATYVNSFISCVRAGGSGNSLVVQNSSPVGAGVVRGVQIELGPDGNEDYTDSGDDFIRFITSNNQEIGGIRGTGAASVSYGTTSDYRLKSPIAEIEDGLAKVRKIVPMYGKWVGQNDPDRVYSYFIAHELQEHIPDAVNGEKDEVDEEGNPEYQSVDYGKLTPTLVAAIKELDATVQTLTARLEALEAN